MKTDKISLYFITPSDIAQESGQCDCSDCDCACPPHNGRDVTTPVAMRASNLLFPSPSLQFYELDTNHEIVMGGNPSPAVLSSACFDVLRAFPAHPKDVIQQRADQCDAKLLENIIQKMFQHGVLVENVPESSSEQAVLSTLSAWIHMTTQCNLGCHYCYLPKQTENLTPDVGYGIVDAILRSVLAQNFSRLKLKYAGGEPLLNVPVLLDNFKYAKAQCEEAGITLEGSVLTNGVLLTKKVAQRLKSAGLSLTVSIDGIEAFHDVNRPLLNGQGSFSLVKKGIETAIEEGLSPRISITISGASADGLPDLVEWILDLDLRFTFNFYRENDLSRNHNGLEFDNRRIIDAILESYRLIETRKPNFQHWNALADRVNVGQPRTYPCSVGRNYLVFDVHGNISSCQMTMDTTLDNFHAPDPLYTVQSISRGPKNIPVSEKPECSTCEWKSWCSGGCPILAERVSSVSAAKSPYCEIYREIIPALIRHQANSLLWNEFSM